MLRKCKNFCRKILIKINKFIYKLRARFEDWRLGGVSIDSIIPTKYKELGVTGTQSTDYRLLDRVFNEMPLKSTAVFMDVGCGEGRVLTYLYLKGYRNRLIGVELDPDVAETAAKRTAKCNNIEIVYSNVFDNPELLNDVNVFYLFNPFDETVVARFIDVIEKNCFHPVTVYYVFDAQARKQIDKRDNWYILRRSVLKRPGMMLAPYSIFQYKP